MLIFPDSSLKAPEGTPVELTVRVRPGVYGVDIDCKAETVGARIIFKYARHFEAPTDGIARSTAAPPPSSATSPSGGSTTTGPILLLATRRPNQDNLSAPIKGNGSYVVAGPR